MKQFFSTHYCRSFLCKVFVLLFVMTSFFSCTMNKKNIEETAYWFTQYSFYSEADYYRYFEANILNTDNPQIAHLKSIKNYYAHNKNRPLWTINGFQEEHIAELMTYLENAKYHGLPGDIFYFDSLRLEIEKIKAYKPDNESELYRSLFHLEMLLTTAYTRYASFIQYGITDPMVVNGNKWLFKYKKVDSLSIYNSLNAFDTLSGYLKSIQPTDIQYVELQKELGKYLNIKKNGFTKIPEIAVDSGKVNKGISLVGDRLKLSGELNPDYQPNDTLDNVLLSALNRFRINNNLEVKNNLDVETITYLNRDFQYYIDKLTANLERYRWKILPEKDSIYIAVNLADFSLQVIRQYQPVLEMKVCCGETLSRIDSVKARTIDGIISPFRSESPMLYSKIDQVVLNPEWFVPESILKNEYFYKLVRDHNSFLEKEKMFIQDYKTRRQLDPDSIKWSKLSKKQIYFRLVQTSGKHNSLGIIKFNFPNSESVYLHDTPLKSAFKKKNRAITHGCIRVEKPLDLGLFIFDYNEYDEKQLEKVMIDLGNLPTTEEGKEYLAEKIEKEETYYEKLSDKEKFFYRKLRPTYIQMSKQVPVYIEYFTCFLGNNGDVQYRNDVYFKESSILYIINHYKI